MRPNASTTCKNLMMLCEQHEQDCQDEANQELQEQLWLQGGMQRRLLLTLQRHIGIRKSSFRYCCAGSACKVAAHLLPLGAQLRNVGQALQGAAAAALLKVLTGRLHGVAVLAQRLQLARDRKALLGRRDARAQALARQRALAEDREAPGQLAHALQQAQSFDRERSCS